MKTFFQIAALGWFGLNPLKELAHCYAKMFRYKTFVFCELIQ